MIQAIDLWQTRLYSFAEAMADHEKSPVPEKYRALYEQSEEENINLFSIAVNHVTSGVTVADARNPELPLIYVNPGFEEITGYAAEEVIGKSCRFLQGKEKDQPDLKVLRAALKNGESCTVRLRNFKKDGSLFHNELHVSAVKNKTGELTHFVGIQLDVTDRVKARESLERSERQTRLALAREAELNEIKSRFISMISHEFRTPMTGAKSSAALLRRFGENLGKEKMERNLENIETSLKRMNRLLDDVLFFSQVEADKVQVILEPVEVGNYFTTLLEALKVSHPGRVVQLRNEVPEGERVQTDVHLLDHIFHNLIGNALKYSPPDLPVEVTVTDLEGHLECTVKDQGIGIPDKDHSKLFEPFHRASNVGNRQGTGLGLNIALRAVELLHGSLSFDSQQGTGTSFVVRIPVEI